MTHFEKGEDNLTSSLIDPIAISEDKYIRLLLFVLEIP